MQKKSQAGFTLVELAIVLMIIGLLIGGVLRGQELMDNARINSTIQQVKAYQGATTTFLDQYDSMPGDMPRALTRLPGCTATSGCVNGDGNGILGTNPNVQAYEDVDATIGSENTQFWKHLATTHMIAGVTPTAQTPEWGKSHPVSKADGGFFARYTNYVNTAATNGGSQSWSGNILVMRNNISGAYLCVDATNCIGTVTPKQASQFDRKMDDGIAVTGDVRAVSLTFSNGCGGANLGGQDSTGYDARNEKKACDIMFKFM